MSEGKTFWRELPSDKIRDFKDAHTEPEVWELTSTRRALLEKLKHGEWVQGGNEVAAPWTFVCCQRAGWIEKHRMKSRSHFRISDEGLAILGE